MPSSPTQLYVAGPGTLKPGILTTGLLSERTRSSVRAPTASHRLLAAPWARAATGPSLPLASAHLWEAAATG